MCTATVGDFKTGHFVVFANDTSEVAPLVQSYTHTQTPDVNLRHTNSDMDVDTWYNLTGFKPKAALLVDGGNWTIHENYLNASGVPVFNDQVEATGTNLLSNCYTFASEP